MKVREWLPRIAMAAVVLLATGCAQIQLGAPVASMEGIQKVRSVGMAPVQLGQFSLAPGKDKALDAGINLRSNSLTSPYGGSFAQYLKETLAVHLRSAGLLEPGALTVIEGQLIDNQLDAAIGTGTGSVAAKFSVNRAGKRLYDKELRAQSSWESSFVGAIAIPAAVNEYADLHRKLIGQLLDDAEFKAAVRR